MRLTEQQRAELKRLRFRPLPISDGGVVIVDYVGQRQWYIGSGDGELAYRRVVELAAVLGITPPGYRLVPEEVAEKALPLVQALTEQKRVVAEELIGAEERAEAFEEYRALMALASALQGKEGEKR